MYTLLAEFLENVRHNLFKPLLLFFYMGFMVPILGVKLDFPRVIYQGLTIFLLVAIGWHEGEELAKLTAPELGRAGGFMAVGFLTNFVIGITAYMFLRSFTRLRRVDAATVAGYYGSDSAGTFAIATGVMLSSQILFAILGALRLGVVHCRPGRSEAGHSRGEPDSPPGGLPGLDVLLKRHDRNPGLYPDCQAGDPDLSRDLVVRCDNPSMTGDCRNSEAHFEHLAAGSLAREQCT
jgi:hypothetical protein